MTMEAQKILRLKEVMKEKGVSRAELAEKLKKSNTMISNYCSEMNYPTYPDLVLIAEILDVDIRELFIPTKEGLVSKNELKDVISDLKTGIDKLSSL